MKPTTGVAMIAAASVPSVAESQASTFLLRGDALTSTGRVVSFVVMRMEGRAWGRTPEREYEQLRLPLQRVVGSQVAASPWHRACTDAGVP